MFNVQTIVLVIVKVDVAIESPFRVLKYVSFRVRGLGD